MGLRHGLSQAKPPLPVPAKHTTPSPPPQAPQPILPSMGSVNSAVNSACMDFEAVRRELFSNSGAAVWPGPVRPSSHPGGNVDCSFTFTSAVLCIRCKCDRQLPHCVVFWMCSSLCFVACWWCCIVFISVFAVCAAVQAEQTSMMSRMCLTLHKLS